MTAGAGRTPGTPQGSHTVLVVDDDDDIREAIGDVLEFEGYRAVMATNGEDALERLRDVPDACVVLLDMMMPVVDGWEFRRRQLDDPALARVPVVVLSGAGRVQQIAQELGVTEYVDKPVMKNRLLQAISRYCSCDRG